MRCRGHTTEHEASCRDRLGELRTTPLFISAVGCADHCGRSVALQATASRTGQLERACYAPQRVSVHRGLPPLQVTVSDRGGGCCPRLARGRSTWHNTQHCMQEAARISGHIVHVPGSAALSACNSAAAPSWPAELHAKGHPTGGSRTAKTKQTAQNTTAECRCRLPSTFHDVG